MRNLPLPERQLLSGVEGVALVWTVAALAGASSVQLMLILAYIGARRRAESHVGFIGACAAFVWLSLQALHVVLANEYLRALCGAILPQTLVINYGHRIEGASYGDLWLAPRLEQFWRSRPISPSAWFWVKYLAGLAAVLGVLDLVTIVAGWNSPHGGQGPNRMSIAYIAGVRRTETA